MLKDITRKMRKGKADLTISFGNDSPTMYETLPEDRELTACTSLTVVTMRLTGYACRPPLNKVVPPGMRAILVFMKNLPGTTASPGKKRAGAVYR